MSKKLCIGNLIQFKYLYGSEYYIGIITSFSPDLNFALLLSILLDGIIVTLPMGVIEYYVLQ